MLNNQEPHWFKIFIDEGRYQGKIGYANDSLKLLNKLIELGYHDDAGVVARMIVTLKDQEIQISQSRTYNAQISKNRSETELKMVHLQKVLSRKNRCITKLKQHIKKLSKEIKDNQ